MAGANGNGRNGNGTARNNGTPKKKAIFLKAVKAKGTVCHACEEAEVGRTTAYRWRDEDAAFALAWKQAKRECVETLEASLYTRGLAGDNTAAIFWLKGNSPTKYRERIDHKVHAKVEHTGDPFSILEDEEATDALDRAIARRQASRPMA